MNNLFNGRVYNINNKLSKTNLNFFLNDIPFTVNIEFEISINKNWENLNDLTENNLIENSNLFNYHNKSKFNNSNNINNNNDNELFDYRIIIKIKNKKYFLTAFLYIVNNKLLNYCYINEIYIKKGFSFYKNKSEYNSIILLKMLKKIVHKYFNKIKYIYLSDTSLIDGTNINLSLLYFYKYCLPYYVKKHNFSFMKITEFNKLLQIKNIYLQYHNSINDIIEYLQINGLLSDSLKNELSKYDHISIFLQNNKNIPLNVTTKIIEYLNNYIKNNFNNFNIVEFFDNTKYYQKIQ